MICEWGRKVYTEKVMWRGSLGFAEVKVYEEWMNVGMEVKENE